MKKIVAGLLLLFACHWSLWGQVQPPNIVVILSDDLSWSLPGFNGGTVVKSPNLDRLSEEGVMLTQFYVQSVCSPTRASFITGRYPFRTGVEERPHANDIAGMLLDERTLAQALGEAGYFTAIVGKWHLGEWKKEHLPMQRGFQYQYGHYSALLDYFTHERDGVHDWHRNEQPLHQEGYSTFLIADEVDHLLKKQDRSKPFFFYVPFNAVHGPMQAPEEYVKKYENTDSHMPAEYLAQFDCMDVAVGRILKSLDDHGFSENTLVVFFNDNGGGGRMRNDPYRGSKGNYYEGGLRVPCVVKWPGKIDPGTKVDEPLHVVDLYPTLINLAGGTLEQELPVDGVDAWKTIAKGKPMPRDEIIHCLVVTEDIGRRAPGAIRQGDYKLIGDELYNIREDPYENTDIADQHPARVSKMKARLSELAMARRPGEKHLPIPGYPPAVYGEEENEAENEAEKPNIIFIYADDLGRGLLGTYGQEIIKTPNIDRLAEGGMRFENAYGCHYCAPARASLLTGMHDCRRDEFNITTAGIYMKLDNGLSFQEIREKIHKVAQPAREDELFLAQVAKQAGYTTAEFGKLDWGFATTPERVARHGWDYHFGYYDHRRCHGFYPPFLFENGEKVDIPGNTHIDCAKTPARETPENYKIRWDMEGKEVYSEDIIMEKLLAYLESHNPGETGKPFFIYFPSQLPHGPISIPEVHPDFKNNASLTEWEKEYASMVKMLDRDVGRIYAKLEELGILENTILVFTGDNGHAPYYSQEGRFEPELNLLTGVEYDNVKTKFYSHLSGDVYDGNDGMAGLKRDNWEGGVRVPLFWYWKGKIDPGEVSEQMVSNYDFLNTLAELVGADQIESKDGVSYAKTLFGGQGDVRDYTFYSSKNMGPAMVSKDGWKLRYYLKEELFQLYYLPDDYREENDLSARYPDRVENMKAILFEECDGNWENGLGSGESTVFSLQIK